jgi:hypothetical protein
LAPTTRALQRAAYDRVTRSRAHRAGLGAPVRDSFFVAHAPDGQPHALASLLSGGRGSGGGRGGRTRVLLYLSLIWVAGGGDHSTTRPAHWWAELLGIPDPDGAGSRMIRNTWDELERRNFVSIDRATTAGDTPTIRPLREDGSGQPYTIPAGHGGDTYRRIPDSAWLSLFHSTELTGPGLVMFLVAIRTYGQAGGGTLTFPRNYFRTEYGIGDSTRKSGLRNLVALGVLDVEGTSREVGGTGARQRGRNVYELNPAYMPPAPTSGSSEAP